MNVYRLDFFLSLFTVQKCVCRFNYVKKTCSLLCLSIVFLFSQSHFSEWFKWQFTVSVHSVSSQWQWQYTRQSETAICNQFFMVMSMLDVFNSNDRFKPAKKTHRNYFIWYIILSMELQIWSNLAFSIVIFTSAGDIFKNRISHLDIHKTGLPNRVIHSCLSQCVA